VGGAESKTRFGKTMSDLLLAIDLGTTVLKAGVIDQKTGRVLSVASQRLPVQSAPNGTREEKLSDIDRAFDTVLGQLRRQLGARWKQIAGIGLAAQGGSFIICNRQTGKALTPMRLWSDQRPLRFLPKITAMRPESYWQELAFDKGPGLGLPRLMWLREQNPKLLSPENIYVGAGEYAIFQLTGQWRQDAGNAVQIGCYRVPARKLAAEPLALVDVSLSFVAPMREGHSTLPSLARWGLPAGIPVAGPYFDHEAGYLGALGVSDRPLQCSLGTAWVGNFSLPANERAHAPGQIVVPAPHNDGWMIVHALWTGNVSWDWALDTFIGGKHSATLQKAAKLFEKQLLPPAGMVALPWMHILNPLKREAVGAGGFFGGGVAAKREDFVRAVALSMTYEMFRVFRQVRDQRKADSVVLGGGASKGASFRQYLATLFAPLPVYALQEEDLAGLRGCVHAFAPRSPAGNAKRVALPKRGDVEKIREGYEVYAELFERVLGRVGNSPFHF